MSTINEIKTIISSLFEKVLSNWSEKQSLKHHGKILELLEIPTFCSEFGLDIFSIRRVTKDNLHSFLIKLQQKSLKKYTTLMEYLGNDTDSSYIVRENELCNILKNELKRNVKYIEDVNFNTSKNNLYDKRLAKYYYGELQARKYNVDSDKVEYHPEIKIEKTVSLIDIEEQKRINYELLEKEHYFATNEDLLEKKETK